MGLDIKFPIGLLFSILGFTITIYGIVTNNNTELYVKSLGYNVNLIIGIIMLTFGLIMLYFSRKTKKKEN